MEGKTSIVRQVAKELGLTVYDIPIFFDEFNRDVPEDIWITCCRLVEWRAQWRERRWKWLRRSGIPNGIKEVSFSSRIRTSILDIIQTFTPRFH